MNDPIDAVRAALNSLADEGRPIDPSGRALARLQRRGRLALVGSAGLVVVVAVSLVWPLLLRVGDTPPGPPFATQTGTWPPFTGVGVVPAPAPSSERLVVAAYSANAGGPIHVLDPTTGEYRPADADRVLAVSPDLRLAVVARIDTAYDENGAGPIGISDVGVLETTTGRILGGLDLEGWNDPMNGHVVSQASWSPDGSRIVLCVRRAIIGEGWQAERLLFVDVRNGATDVVEIRPSGTLEAVDLLGWTTDGGSVILTADRVGTDQTPSGHLVYDDTGALLADVTWTSQGNAIMVIGRDEIGLTSVDGGQISVVDVRTGEVRQPPVNLQGLGSGTPVAWRGNEMVVREDRCDLDGRCTAGPDIVAIVIGTGERRPLHVLAESQARVVVAPAGGLASGRVAAW